MRVLALNLPHLRLKEAAVKKKSSWPVTPGNSATVPRYQAGLVLVTIKKKKEEKKKTSTLHRDSKLKAHTDACRTINHSV